MPMTNTSLLQNKMAGHYRQQVNRTQSDFFIPGITDHTQEDWTQNIDSYTGVCTAIDRAPVSPGVGWTEAEQKVVARAMDLFLPTSQECWLQ